MLHKESISAKILKQRFIQSVEYIMKNKKQIACNTQEKWRGGQNIYIKQTGEGMSGAAARTGFLRKEVCINYISK